MKTEDVILHGHVLCPNECTEELAVAVDRRVDPIQDAEQKFANHGRQPTESMVVMTLIMRVQQVVLARADEVLKPLDLGLTRYQALMALTYEPEGTSTPGELSWALMVHPTTVTAMIDRLEERGLVKREPHPTDRRASLVVVTAAGRALAEKADAAIIEANFGLPAIKKTELRQLRQLLWRVREMAGDVVDITGET